MHALCMVRLIIAWSSMGTTSPRKACILCLVTAGQTSTPEGFNPTRKKKQLQPISCLISIKTSVTLQTAPIRTHDVVFVLNLVSGRGTKRGREADVYTSAFITVSTPTTSEKENTLRNKSDRFIVQRELGKD